jgi:hypothetical protein
MHQAKLRIGNEPLDLKFQLSRKPSVVRIQERQQVSARHFGALVPSCGNTAVRLPH